MSETSYDAVRNQVFDKYDYISVACSRRDQNLLSWACSFVKGWKDPSVPDVDTFRRILLEHAQGWEDVRAVLVGQKPRPYKVMAKELISAMKYSSHRQCYTHGIPFEIDEDSAIISL